RRERDVRALRPLVADALPGRVAAGAVRPGLVAGTALAGLLVVLQLHRYPGMLRDNPPLEVALYLAVLTAGLGVALAAALAGPRARGGAWRGAVRDGCAWGLALGALWLVEIAVGNLGSSLGSWTLVPYFGSTAAVLVLTVVAGARGARRYRRRWAGTLVGTWSGLVSGLIVLAGLQLLALAAMPTLRSDPQNLSEFGGGAHLSSHIAGDLLAAGVNHLVLIGLVGGSLLATLGAAIGEERAAA